MATYNEEFQKLALRSRVQEAKTIKVATYINGIKWYELSLFSLTTLWSYCQMARKVEEKLRKKGHSSSKNRGRSKDFKRGSRGGSSSRSND